MEQFHKFCRTLKLLRLGWIIPILLLIKGEDRPAQMRAIGQQIVAPVLAIIAFLVLWLAVSAKIETKFGNVPGPKQVAAAWTSLREEAARERIKEKEFYERQNERLARLREKFPDKTYEEKQYAGKPTYGRQIVTSLETVFAGFLIASLIAVPLGIVCGLNKTIYSAINPLIQVFKPVSPLAWLPIVWIVVSALYTPQQPMFEISFINSAITVALCSLWPTLINTAVGVASINPDHINVARVLKLGWFTRVRKIVLPSALPLIFTGLRLSLGVGWMVLIAAEMLAQNPGLGKFVWDMFQNGSSETVAMIMVAVVTIGVIGFFLDTVMHALQQLVSFEANH